MNDGDTTSDNIVSANILKCRDDPKPVFFKPRDGDSVAEPLCFLLNEGSACSWAKDDEEIGPDKLRPRIEPWLTALCQSEHLTLLLGSGLSNSVHRIATGKLLSGMAMGDFGDQNDVIKAEAEKSAQLAGRGKGNIEDQIRVANELLRGFEILGPKHKKAKEHAKALRENLKEVLQRFAADILDGEQGVINAEDSKRALAFNYLVSFLMSFASRTGTRDRLHIFTTNYDRFIEAGAETAGLHLLDRFVGSIAPIFRSSRLDLDMHYNPPGIRGEPRYLEGVARFTKLHGSLDWMAYDRNIRRLGVPFGATDMQPYLSPPGATASNARGLMIYPNAAKDRETSFYPYIELFRDFAAATCRPNHTLTVLSQCNTFLLHRISNDRDQELVQRLVPDNLRGLLRELPSLPSQRAILLGWASELPVLVKMDDLPKMHQPHSNDPDFWDVWIGKDTKGNVVERKAEWKPVADDWQGKGASSTKD